MDLLLHGSTRALYLEIFRGLHLKQECYIFGLGMAATFMITCSMVI
jgi:hypothetical protein